MTRAAAIPCRTASSALITKHTCRFFTFAGTDVVRGLCGHFCRASIVNNVAAVVIDTASKSAQGGHGAVLPTGSGWLSSRSRELKGCRRWCCRGADRPAMWPGIKLVRAICRRCVVGRGSLAGSRA